MSTQAEKNKEAFRTGVENVFNQRKLDMIDDLFADDVFDHGAPPDQPAGLEGKRAAVHGFVGAFSDLNLNYEHVTAEGDFVAGRFVLSGTHDGDFGGIPATGNTVKVIGHDLVRMRDGKVCETWLQMDTLGLMQQLGVIDAS